MTELGAEYVVFAFGVAAVPALADPIRASLRDVAQVCGPAGTARIPLTLLGPGSDRTSVHDPATVARLRAVKRSADPQGVIRGNHPLD
jgi:hypothetical protein